VSDTADLNLVLAVIKPADALQARAERHLQEHMPYVPFSVGIELLLVMKKWGLPMVAALGATEARFEVEGRDILYTAAEALDAGEVSTVLDAVHLADALHRGGRLHTADEALLRTPFPTAAF
jgi:predicted nucleic acid-binding protein